MSPLDLINHIRQCSLEEVRLKLERLQSRQPDLYLIVENFFLSCEPKEPARE
jgi:hypothetical protein